MRGSRSPLLCVLAGLALACTSAPLATGESYDAPLDFRESARPTLSGPEVAATPASRAYDVAVLREVLTCLDAPPELEPSLQVSSAARALCGCLAQAPDGGFVTVDLVAVVGDGGKVSRLAVGPRSPLGHCIESRLHGAEFPAPPVAPCKLALSFRAPE